MAELCFQHLRNRDNSCNTTQDAIITREHRPLCTQRRLADEPGVNIFITQRISA